MPRLVLDEPEITSNKKLRLVLDEPADSRLVLDEEPKQKLSPKLVLDEESTAKRPKQDWMGIVGSLIKERITREPRKVISDVSKVLPQIPKVLEEKRQQYIKHPFKETLPYLTPAGPAIALKKGLGLIRKIEEPAYHPFLEEVEKQMEYEPKAQWWKNVLPEIRNQAVRMITEYTRPSSIAEIAIVGKVLQHPAIKEVITKKRFLPSTLRYRLDKLLGKEFPVKTLTPEELVAKGKVKKAIELKPELFAEELTKRITPERPITEAVTIPTTQERVKAVSNINMSKFSPEVQKGMTELIKQSPEITQRPIISNTVLGKMANELKDTPTVKNLSTLPEGQLEAEILKTRQGNADFIKASLEKDLTEFKQDINPILDTIKTDVEKQSKMAATMGRGLQQFKIPIEERTKLIKAIDEKINQFKKDPILGKDKLLLDKLKEMRSLVGGKDFNPTLFDKVYEVWLNSILANPMTHLVNTASNLLFTLYKPLEKAFAATVETPYALLTGKRTHYFGEIPRMIKGFGKALVTKPSEVATGTKLDIIRPPAIQGIKGEIIRIPTKALQIEDDLFKHFNGMMELYSRGYVEAKKTGELLSKLVKEPPYGLKSKVYEEQLYRTFQDQLGKTGNALMNLRSSVPGMRWVMPFIKTPANIMKRALERTPLALGKVILKAGKKQYTQKELFEDLGLLALGGATTGAVVYQYMKGNITGNVPKKKADRDLFYRQGKQPNSFRISDTWIPFSRYEPLGLSISLITNMIQDYMESDKDIPQEKIADAVFGLAKTLSNKSYLSGMTNFINTIQRPEQYGERFASRLAAGFVPYSGLARFLTGIVDPTLRRPVGVKESIKAQIPGLSKTIRPRLNAFGEEIKRAGMWTKEEVSPVDKELLSLGISVGFPSNRILGRKLTENEYNEYLKESGSMIKLALSRMFQLPGYKALSKEEKIEAVEIIVREAREKVRKGWIQ